MRSNLLKKYIDEDQYDHGSSSLSSSSSSYGRKSRNSSSSSESGGSSSSGSGAGSFNIKNLDDDEERDQRRYEIQCELNSQGASDLVVDLFMNDISNKVFKETVLLAIALLEGGNTHVQVRIFKFMINFKNIEYIITIISKTENNLSSSYEREKFGKILQDIS